MSIGADAIATLPIFYGRSNSPILSFAGLCVRPYISVCTDRGLGDISDLLAHILVPANKIVCPCPCGGYRSGYFDSRSRHGQRATVHLPFHLGSHLSNHGFAAVSSTPSSKHFSQAKTPLLIPFAALAKPKTTIIPQPTAYASKSASI